MKKKNLLFTLIATILFSYSSSAQEYTMVGVEEEITEAIIPMSSAIHKGNAKPRMFSPTHSWYDEYTKWKIL